MTYPIVLLLQCLLAASMPSIPCPEIISDTKVTSDSNLTRSGSDYLTVPSMLKSFQIFYGLKFPLVPLVFASNQTK